jgi:hypothetical protein
MEFEVLKPDVVPAWCTTSDTPAPPVKIIRAWSSDVYAYSPEPALPLKYPD